MIKSHSSIDERGLRLAMAIVEKLEQNGIADGLQKARKVNAHWRAMSSSTLHDEWANILRGSWDTVRQALLDESETGDELRQNNPFCGILSNQERWAIFEEFRHHAD
jgi:hypothetical protein